MTTMPTREIVSGVFAIDAPFEDAPLLSFVVDGDGLTVIDPGVVDTPLTHLEPALQQMGRSLSEVKNVIITHAHHDHCGGLGQIHAANPKIEVIAHHNDSAWINDTDLFVRDNYYGFAPIWTPPADFEARVRRLKGPEIPVTKTVGGGDRIDLGGGHQLTVVDVPAHTCGHIALLHEEGDILFTGDSLIGRGHLFQRRLDYFPLYSSVSAYEQALTRYEELDPTYVATAHHGVCDRVRTAFLIHESRQLINEIRDFLRAELDQTAVLTLADAVQRAEAHWPRYVPGPNTCTTIRAHLQELVEIGEATQLDWTVMEAWSTHR